MRLQGPCLVSLRTSNFRSVMALQRSFHASCRPCVEANEKSDWRSKWKALADNKEINTIPNMITMARIAASPLLSVAIAYDMKVAALSGCVIFGLTDWLDGFLARKLNQRTVFGAFLDPMADKVFIGALTLGLVVKGLIPLPLAGVILGRDAALLGASFALRAIERPAGAPFFDTTDSATFRIVPSELSKINTGVQIFLLSATLANFATGVPSLATIEPLWWITATTTLSSGLLYLDGSGRRKITRHVKEAVSDKVGPQVRAVESKVKAVESKVKDIISAQSEKFKR